jgi:hypothetical protein
MDRLDKRNEDFRIGMKRQVQTGNYQSGEE